MAHSRSHRNINPVRKERLYNEGLPGYATDEIVGERHYKPDEFHDEDEEQIYAELAESGAEYTEGDQEDENEEGVYFNDDREYELSKIANEPTIGRLDEEDRDLDQLPKLNPLKADREL